MGCEWLLHAEIKRGFCLVGRRLGVCERSIDSITAYAICDRLQLTLRLQQTAAKIMMTMKKQISHKLRKSNKMTVKMTRTTTVSLRIIMLP